MPSVRPSRSSAPLALAGAAAVLAACSAVPVGLGTSSASAGARPYAGGAAATADESLAPGSDLPPGMDPGRIADLVDELPGPVDWTDVDPDPAIPSPADVLGFEIGERFTRHGQLEDWCEALAEASPRVRLVPYGRSWQGRDLMVMVITAPEHQDRLDEIMAASRGLARPGELSDSALDAIVEDTPAITWMSFSVHGNEASCTEAAILVSHRLAAGRTPEIERILEDSVVVIDPVLNPDGRARYVSFFQQHVGMEADPFPLAAEHREPWPSGRSNHYMFDLNRDWVWGTQAESAARIPIYRRFMPQLHLDVHEQGIHSPYFLGAGDTPYHAEVRGEERSWFEVFGRAMGADFDAARLEYATRERFDYLYPGYGKVLPVHHGAVGLLFEQAGHGRAGRAITIDDDHGGGYVLTLRDRAEHHAIATLSAAHANAVLREAQLRRFADYFETAMTPADGAPTAWVIRPQDDPRPRAELAELLALHGIELHRLTEAARVGAGDLETFHPPFTAGEDAVDLPAGTWVVPSGQPMGRLARVLLERDPAVEDRDTYDITAWSVPPMFGLDAMAYFGPVDALAVEPVDPAAAAVVPVAPTRGEDDADAVALLVPSDHRGFVHVLAEATRQRVWARLLGDDVLLEGGTVMPRGSLALHVARTRFDDAAAVSEMAIEAGVPAVAVSGSIPASGPTLGNNANRRFIAPRRVVVASHSPVSSLSVGHLRHMLEHRGDVPHSIVRAEDLRRLDLSEVDVVVVPSVWSLDAALGSGGVDAMRDWVRGGGTVVAFGRGAGWAARTFLDGAEADVAGAPEDSDDLADVPGGDLHELTFAERQRRGVERRVPGAILSATVDTTHPLAAGVPERLAFHVFGDDPMPVRSSTYVVARFAELDDAGGPRVGGVAGPRALRRLAGAPAVTHDRVGGGIVIRFASDPTNRGINRAGMDLLARTILLGPSFAPSRQPLGGEDVDAARGDLAREAGRAGD